MQLLLATLGGREAVGDLLLAILDRLQQRGPDELDAEPDQDQEDDRLADERLFASAQTLIGPAGNIENANLSLSRQRVAA